MNNIEKYIQAFSNEISELTPVEWAEKNRILTSDITPFPGPLSYKRTPYIKEIVNCVMPNCPAKIISIMKGSQIGITVAGLLTILGWIIKQSPANTLYIAKDDQAIKRAFQGPIDQMINSSDLSHLVGSGNVRGKRKTSGSGDTNTSKRFKGGNLYSWSGQVLGKLSELSVKYGLYDEVERYKGIDTKGGDFYSLILARHKAYKESMKLFFVSTPEIKQTSNIEPIYFKGDQRNYFLPCKNCGEYITIEWQKEIEGLKDKAGVYFKRDKSGRLVKDSVGYVCQKCGGFFKEDHKYDMLDEDLGKWQPTAEPLSELYRSYKLNSLIAPAGMFGWTDYAQQWCEIYPKDGNINTEKLKTFINQTLAETYEELSKDVETKQLLKNTRNYEINTIPNSLSKQDGNGNIILLTCAIDLNGKIDDARLDYEIVGWSESGSSYSIDHGSIGTFERSKNIRLSKAKDQIQKDQERTKFTYKLGHKNNVWDEFKKTIMIKVYEKDDGTGKLKVPMFGIDTGHFTVHAMSFIKNEPLCVALKGKSDSKFTSYDSDKYFYTISKEVEKLYLVEGDRVKDSLANNIELVWSEDLETDQPPGFLNFPKPTVNPEKYTYKSYFHEYEGEKRQLQLNDAGTAIGFKWSKKHNSSHNHFFDCRVYNIVVKHIFSDKFCKIAKRPQGWSNFVSLFKQLN